MLYVDDCLSFSKEKKSINALVEKMCDHKFEHEYEYQIIIHLISLDIFNNGIRDDNAINFIKARHVNCLLALTGMNDFTPKDTTEVQTHGYCRK